MHNWASLKSGDSSRSASCGSVRRWMLHRSRVEMEGLKRSSRRALERGGNGQWAVGNGEEGDWYAGVAEQGEFCEDPSEPTSSAQLPRPPLADRVEGQEEAGSSGNAALKSYCAKRFELCCMREFSHAACAAQGESCGVRVNGARGWSVRVIFLNAKGAKGSKRGMGGPPRRTYDMRVVSWADICLGCFKDMQGTSSAAGHLACREKYDGEKRRVCWRRGTISMRTCDLDAAFLFCMH